MQRRIWSLPDLSISVLVPKEWVPSLPLLRRLRSEYHTKTAKCFLCTTLPGNYDCRREKYCMLIQKVTQTSWKFFILQRHLNSYACHLLISAQIDVFRLTELDTTKFWKPTWSAEEIGQVSQCF